MPKMKAAVSVEPWWIVLESRPIPEAGPFDPGGHSNACLSGQHSQDGAGTRRGFRALGGWRFGNTTAGTGKIP